MHTYLFVPLYLLLQQRGPLAEVEEGRLDEQEDAAHAEHVQQQGAGLLGDASVAALGLDEVLAKQKHCYSNNYI